MLMMMLCNRNNWEAHGISKEMELRLMHTRSHDSMPPSLNLDYGYKNVRVKAMRNVSLQFLSLIACETSLSQILLKATPLKKPCSK